MNGRESIIGYGIEQMSSEVQRGGVRMGGSAMGKGHRISYGISNEIHWK